MQPQKNSTTGYLALIDGGRSVGVAKGAGGEKASAHNLTNGWLKPVRKLSEKHPPPPTYSYH